MDKKGLIGTLVIVVVLLVVGFFWFVGQRGGEVEEEVECVAASCCHPTECVLESEAPDCNRAFCTMSCEPDTMDCGQGHCEYIDGECGVVWDE